MSKLLNEQCHIFRVLSLKVQRVEDQHRLLIRVLFLKFVYL